MSAILVTGALGFTATYLVSELRVTAGSDIAIHGLDREEGRAPQGTICHRCDLTNASQLVSLLREIQPARVYHLAGSFSNDFDTNYAANVVSTKNLLEAVRSLGLLSCRILIVGSAAEYGHVESSSKGITEASALLPVSVYGLTKVFQTQLAQYYARVHGIHTIIARVFNLIGRGISTRLFIGALHEQIKLLRRGESNEIHVGNVSGERDYIDVRDAARAYQAALENGRPGEVYNVGSGRLVKIEDVLNLFLQYYGIERDRVKCTHERKSPSDGYSYFADTAKVRDLGWVPQLDIQTSVKAFTDGDGA